MNLSHEKIIDLLNNPKEIIRILEQRPIPDGLPDYLISFGRYIYPHEKGEHHTLIEALLNNMEKLPSDVKFFQLLWKNKNQILATQKGLDFFVQYCKKNPAFIEFYEPLKKALEQHKMFNIDAFKWWRDLYVSLPNEIIHDMGIVHYYKNINVFNTKYEHFNETVNFISALLRLTQQDVQKEHLFNQTIIEMVHTMFYNDKMYRYILFRNKIQSDYANKLVNYFSQFKKVNQAKIQGILTPDDVIFLSGVKKTSLLLKNLGYSDSDIEKKRKNDIESYIVHHIINEQPYISNTTEEDIFI